MSDQPVVATPKPWYESRTIWTNASVVIVTLLTFFLDQQRAGVLPFTLSEEWLMFILGLIGAVNVALRSVTKQPVSMSKEE